VKGNKEITSPAQAEGLGVNSEGDYSHSIVYKTKILILQKTKIRQLQNTMKNTTIKMYTRQQEQHCNGSRPASLLACILIGNPDAGLEFK
jgi:hypothetical protein